jgi:hypothetical protein
MGLQKDAAGVKNGPGFLNVHLHAKTMDAAGNPGLGAFDNPTSIVMPSQQMGRLQAILLLTGAKIPTPCSLGQLKEITETTFAQSPKLKITTRWEAQVKLADGTYQTVRTGQRNFPPVLDENNKPTGRYHTEVVDPKTGLVGNAQVRIIRYARA